ncbi:MAG: hypothetical protein IPM81_18760 [Saprospirales bacterium]|jgi:hypothetical protein|nr:hypothetical protein [Saprospirales bacterium]
MKNFPLLFCALFSVCALTSLQAATKSEQLERYLGSFRYKNDRPLGTVKFIFQKAVLKRQGDGKKTYEQLLFNERYFSNRDNAGQLIGIQIVHKGVTSTIRPESPKDPDEVEAPATTASTRVRPAARAKREPEPERRANADEKPQKSREGARPVRTAGSAAAAAAALSSDPVRPRQNDAPLPPSGISLPDSVTVARNIDQAKETITGWKGKMWQTVRPAWEFVMWMFSSIIVMLICFAGICRYVAKTAATESLINSYGRIIVGRWIVSAHQNAAAMLLIVTWIIAIVLLVDVFMWLVFLNLPIWTLLVIWFPILWIAEKLTSWIVPNITVIGPGGAEHR